MNDHARVERLAILLQVVIGHFGRLELDQLRLVAVLDVLEVLRELLLPRREIALLRLDLTAELGLLLNARGSSARPDKRDIATRERRTLACCASCFRNFSLYWASNFLYISLAFSTSNASSSPTIFSKLRFSLRKRKLSLKLRSTAFESASC